MTNTYANYREKFSLRARELGAIETQYAWPVCGPQQEELSVSTFGWNMEGATRALVVISGTHGAEVVPGMDIQSNFMQLDLESMLGDTALFYICGLNAWGAVTGERGEHDRVDPNRGCGPTFESTSAYGQYLKLFHPQRWNGRVREQLRITLLNDTEGRIRKAAISGQYEYPDGIFYGGTRPCASAHVLNEIFAEPVWETMERVAVVDLHTGIGTKTVALSSVQDEESIARAKCVFAESVVQFIHHVPSATASVSGDVMSAIRRLLPRTEITDIALEKGYEHTIPASERLVRILAENWLYHHQGECTPEAAALIRHEFAEVFYQPDNVTWNREWWQECCEYLLQAAAYVKS